MDLIATQTAPVVAGALYRVEVAARVDGAAGPKPPAILAVRFQDAEGRVLPAPGEEPPEGLALSPRFGTFRYLFRPGQEGRRSERLELRAPAGAVRVALGLHRWHAETVTLAAPLSIDLAPPPGLEPAQGAAMTRHLMGIAEDDVRPGETYLVAADFEGPLPAAERAVLAAVQFTTAEGTPLPASAELTLSEAIGPYRYFPPVAEGGAPRSSFALAAPEGAARMHVQFLRWECPAGVALAGYRIGALSDPAVALARGDCALRPGRPHRLTATLLPERRRAGPVARVGLRFTDAEGLRVARSDDPVTLFDRPGPGEDWPALCRAGLAFFPPPGAERLSWWIEEIADAPGLALAAPVEVAEMPGKTPDPVTPLVATLPKGRRWSAAGLEPAGLRRGLAAGAPPWTFAARGELELLAEWAAPAPQGRWNVLSGRLRKGARPEGHVLLCPVFLDAEGSPLTETRPLGCTRIGQAGICRPATLRDGPGGAGFREAFLAPENSATLLVHAFLWPGVPGDAAKGLLEGLSLAPAVADEIGEDLAIDEMSQTQLRCALQVAQSVGHLQAEARIQAALSAYEARPAGHTAQARQLQDRLKLLDPGFLPDLPAPDADTAAAPAADAPALVLARDAGRHAAGLFDGAPLCAPLSDRGPGATAEQADARDGICRDGARRAPVLSAWPPESLRPTDRACLNARFFADALRDSGAGLVHAVADGDDPGLALAGLAVAARHRLPFVYERHGLSEHDWRPPGATHLGNLMSRLRLAQEWRLMQAADMVVVPSRALEEALAAQHLPRARIALVPRPLDAAFLAPPPPGEAVPRDSLGLGAQTALIGWTPDPDAPGMTDLLAGALAGLAEEGVALHLLCLDAAAPPAMLAALPDRVTATGPLRPGARRAWTAACDLAVVPRPDGQRHGFLPPRPALEALACHLPVLVSEIECLAEIAAVAPGASLSRIARPATPAILGAALRRALEALPSPAEARRARAAPPPKELVARHRPEAARERLQAAHATARTNARARIGTG